MAGKKSIRAEKTPPRKTRDVKQMIDIRGFPLTTELGAPLTTEKDVYRRNEYGADYSASIVIDSKSYQKDSLSTQNSFSKGSPAALPIEEQFREQSEVSRSLLGVNRETTQQGLFSNVSTYGLDPKDWKVDGSSGYIDRSNRLWWTRRPTATGSYYPISFREDDKNSAILISANPTPFLEPRRPSVNAQLIGDESQDNTQWGQYINSLVALYLFKYMVNNFDRDQWELYNLLPVLNVYAPIKNPDGTYSFNDLFWDKLWLDLEQNRFSASDRPIIPLGKAFNFLNSEIENWRSNTSLWGTSDVLVSAQGSYPQNLNTSWDSFFFSTTRIYYPLGNPDENKGHFRIKTNPEREIWDKYHGVRWDEIRQDLKDWEFTVHASQSTITDVEKELKLPYFLLDFPLVPDPVNNRFSSAWPSALYGKEINLPSESNRIGGARGTSSKTTLKSIRSFRYQPGRISGFTYGVKVSDIGAGPGTTIEFGIENETDAYMFRLSNGSLFSVVRRSTVPLEDTEFLNFAEYQENTREVVVNGVVQYETEIEQKIMNGDPLGGEGNSGYILDFDKVTMYKIEFGWYGAIGARFYAYIPVENNECRWVTLHTLVIENQLGRPCLADPFFYFKYRLNIADSSTIRVDQFIYKFGASYYIDGYDEGTLYSLNAQSKTRNLPNPKFSYYKRQLNAIDWVTLMGIKPRQFLINRFGTELYNKKEIFPEDMYVYSQQDCEIKIVRQSGCPEWAYTHQEGYRWNILPEERRLKGKFNVVPYFQNDFAPLGIIADDPSTHSAVITYTGISGGGFRSPANESNWSIVGNQPITRLVGQDLYGLYTGEEKDFGVVNSDTLNAKIYRDLNLFDYLSSRRPAADFDGVYLPFTYPLIPPFTDGYDIEFDYYRRDQVLLSTVDVFSSEFYIYWVGGDYSGLTDEHLASLRFGFVWPTKSDKEVLEFPEFNDFPENPSSSNLYKDLSTNKVYTWTGTLWKHVLYASGTDIEWGIEKNAVYDNTNQSKEYVYTEGLPFDFATDYPENAIYVENNVLPSSNTYNLESREDSDEIGGLNSGTGLSSLISVPGAEGGICRGLYCKAGREIREKASLIKDNSSGVDKFYIADSEAPWPNLGDKSFNVTITQGSNVVNVLTTGGEVLTIGDAIQYVLPLSSQPAGISLGEIRVTYNLVYIATIDKQSKPKFVLVSSVSPGDVPFYRVFLQGRQGAGIGGVWIGQKTSNGIKLSPFTPHKSTVGISDSNISEYHPDPDPLDPNRDGALKSIRTFTALDKYNLSTAPTYTTSPLDTRKSIHLSPRKCGSFLSSSGVNSAGIFTASDYPIRWLTSSQGNPVATYYVSANTPTQIDLRPIFNVSGESIVNEDDGNLATFFIARAINNPETGKEDNNEIYMSLNYSEQ